jgi:threonine/homoserine/homoserine lactone efflux protein
VNPDFLLRGLMIGFSIAAPVGPIGILCIRRTLAKGGRSGFVSGLGAATADAFYGMVAGFGVTMISNYLVSQQKWLKVVGGIFLLYLGVKMFFRKPAAEPVKLESTGLVSDYGSTFFLTLTNPATILSFTAVFAGVGLAGSAGNHAAAGLLVAGVFLGSALWWLLLSGGTSLFRQRFDSRKLRFVDWISGAILCAFGLIALLSS